MKEPEGVRGVACPFCKAKAGEPCMTPGEAVRKVAAHEHAPRWRALEDARVTWAKWQRWHEGAPK